VVGPEAARTVQTIIENAKERPDLATLSGFFGIITLLLSASLIFGEMKFAFNKIYECEPVPPVTGSFAYKVWIMARTKIAQIGLALCCIFIMIISLLASSVISAAVPTDQPFWRVFNLIISFIFYIGLFALIFHSMPDERIAWKDSFRGGVITAFLFLVGKELIALYLGHSAIGSPYGVAGSLILLLVWIYYTALITFVGAHISSLIASKSGSQPSRPHDNGRRPVKREPVPAR
jgi:membrane protein